MATLGCQAPTTSDRGMTSALSWGEHNGQVQRCNRWADGSLHQPYGRLGELPSLYRWSGRDRLQDPPHPSPHGEDACPTGSHHLEAVFCRSWGQVVREQF